MAGLEKAVRENRFRQVDLLIRLGSDVNFRLDGGKSLLMICCLIDNSKAALKLTKLLHEKGAKLDLVDNKCKNALIHSVINNKPLIVNYLLQNMHDFNVNAGDKDGNTALHYAVGLGLFNIVEMLVKGLRKYDLTLSKRNFFGYTPLMIAIERDLSAIEIYLRSVMSSKKVPSEYPGFLSPGSGSSTSWLRSMDRRKENVPGSFLCKIDAPKLERSKTTPAIRPLRQKKPYRSSFNELNLRIDEFTANYSRCPTRRPNCKDALQGLFDLWQRQLSFSYRPTAEPIYDDYGSDDLSPELLSVFQDSDSSRPASTRSGVSSRLGLKSVSPFPQTRTSVSLSPQTRTSVSPSPQKRTSRSAESYAEKAPGANIDMLLPPSPTHFRQKSAGRPDRGNQTLRVPSARRSRSASPRPIIKVDSVFV